MDLSVIVLSLVASVGLGLAGVYAALSILLLQLQRVALRAEVN
jgi:hypothetical protein